MRIFRIEIENFRLLKKIALDLEKELSLVIGKNNTGKTSILAALDRFLNSPESRKFSFDDFNVDFKKQLRTLVEATGQISDTDFKNKPEVGIKLRLFIEYGPNDNLCNLSKVIMDLDPANNVAVIGFGYLLSYGDYLKMRQDYAAFQSREDSKKAQHPVYSAKDSSDFLKASYVGYFKVVRKALAYDLSKGAADESITTLLDDKSLIGEIINFKHIGARRDVANSSSDKTLSDQTSRIYEGTEAGNSHLAQIEEFKDILTKTDGDLTKVYKGIFKEVVQKVKNFGGVRPSESDIEIISTLQHQGLLEGNTTVVYRHGVDDQLPEHYNGLGYMNLISMIFEIEILMRSFRRSKEARPSDINLLFIEEPEAHTHPQMQSVFIKNIKSIIREGVKRDDGENRDVQYIISTHSSCIVAESDFDDIKYLKREGGGVVAKNLKDLKKDYSAHTEQYEFLKQYLTISRAEIFFADKAVLIEGDTERILVPVMMKKIDIEEASRHKATGTTDPSASLLSQNVSLVEVGAYSQIFEKFIDFVGIKTLIITDLDAVDAGGEACPVGNGVGYSNASISHFFDTPTLDQLKGFSFAEKKRAKVIALDAGGNTSEKWVSKADGRLCVVYQTSEAGYHARSFEDGFIHLNRAFIASNKDKFKGLKNRSFFDDAANDAFKLAGRCVQKKTHFALDIIFSTNDKFDNWSIPGYIKEGLLWLKED